MAKVLFLDDYRAGVHSYYPELGERKPEVKMEALKAQAVDDHLGVNPDAVNWGNVGTAQHLLALLNEAAAVAGIK